MALTALSLLLPPPSAASQTDRRTVILLHTDETGQDEQLRKQHARVTAELESAGLRVSKQHTSTCGRGSPAEILGKEARPTQPSAAICLTQKGSSYTAFIAVRSGADHPPDEYSISTPISEQEFRDPIALKIAELLHGALIQLAPARAKPVPNEPAPEPLPPEATPSKPPAEESPSTASPEDDGPKPFSAGIGFGATHTYSGLNTFWGLFLDAAWHPTEKVVVGAEAFFPVLEAKVRRDGLEASIYATVMTAKAMLSLELNSRVTVLPGLSAGALWARVDGVPNDRMEASNDKAAVFVLGLPVSVDFILSRILRLRAHWSALLLEKDLSLRFGEEKVASFGRVSLQWSVQIVFLF